MTREEVLMGILKFPVNIWMRTVFQPKLVKNELRDSKKPALIIGNHVTFEDPILGMMYTNRPISYLAASMNMDDPFKNFIFRVFKIIPFTKGQMDIKAIRQLRKYANKKSVGLYPEGGRTWDGSNIDIIESIASLVKMLRVDVYSVDLQGFYFIKPRWAKKYRRGRTAVEVVKVMDAQDAKTKTQQEILDIIKDAVYYNEYDRQREAKIPYRGIKIAESIEKVLFKCPDCGAVDTITSRGDIFWCTKCKKQYSFDKYGFITGCDKFDNPHDWNIWQSGYIDEIVKNDLPIVNEKTVVTFINSKGKKTAKRDFTIDKSGVTIDDTYIPFEDINSPNLVLTDVLEFFTSEGRVRIKLHPKKHSSLTLLEKVIKNLSCNS